MKKTLGVTDERWNELQFEVQTMFNETLNFATLIKKITDKYDGAEQSIAAFVLGMTFKDLLNDGVINIDEP